MLAVGCWLLPVATAGGISSGEGQDPEDLDGGFF